MAAVAAVGLSSAALDRHGRLRLCFVVVVVVPL